MKPQGYRAIDLAADYLEMIGEYAGRIGDREGKYECLTVASMLRSLHNDNFWFEAAQ